MGSTIKISEDARKILEEISQKTGKGIAELASEAIVSYYRAIDPSKEISSITPLRPIILKFKSRCNICQRELQPGQISYYQKVTYSDKTSRSIIICHDCHETDEQTLRRYMKKLELERVIKALQNKLRKYADSYTLLKKAEEIDRLSDEVVKYLRDLKMLFVEQRDEEVAKNIQNLIAKIDELSSKMTDLIKDIDVIIKSRIKTQSRYTYRS